jgi:hypothetical protein
MKRTPDYLAYLLRLWRDNQKQAWRATVQNPHTGERYTFASLPALLVFLETETGQPWGVDTDGYTGNTDETDFHG